MDGSDERDEKDERDKKDKKRDWKEMPEPTRLGLGRDTEIWASISTPRVVGNGSHECRFSGKGITVVELDSRLGPAERIG
ncbi:hypothetical protein [Natrialba sp. SSL1]|uniref:hypothetical protein n=1 Tax=Natrialba sp. SSL1 TaxID=1869245 RepID=UPI0008F7F2FE|nr:hypothetical protein [Natrialba sp. SSL1]OIB57944.1 hypothetical protein BBD46_11155 [Natrialba sp. SSL1]